MEWREPRGGATLRAADVPRAPRPVPPSAILSEHVLPLATGTSWLLIGTIALVVGRLEGLPPPERSDLGAGLAWLLGLSLLAAGAVLLSWGLVRSSWWSRLQRHGRAADARVTGVRPLSWIRVAGQPPLDLELSFEDAGGRPRTCRARARPSRREAQARVGATVVVIHSLARPEDAVLYWKKEKARRP